jgi:hypothetical protein
VSGRDAFEDEMGFLGPFSDADVERALAGLASMPGADGDLDELTSFVVTLKGAVPVRPGAALEASLVPRLASRARAAGEGAASALTAEAPAAGARTARSWSPRLALAAKVAVAIALVPALVSGMAFAGVTLPEPAREAFESVGIELPNQGGEQAGGVGASGGDRAGENRRQLPRSSDAWNRGANAERSAAAIEPTRRDGRDREGRQADGHPAAGDGANGVQPHRPAGTGNHDQAASLPRENGPAGVPPGHGGTPPGHGGTPPGLSNPPPGHGATPPGQGGAIPGSGSGGRSVEPRGPSAGVPPGQAKPK